MSRQWRSDDTSPWTYGFGDGHDGDLTVTSSVSYSGANQSCSGSSGGTSLTLDAAGSFSNGDLVLIHQSRGTGAGAWELNKISSGAGTTSLTLTHALQNTYTDSGASQAQILEMKEYDNVTVGTSGVLNPPATWNQNIGGIIAFFCKTAFTQTAGDVNVIGDGFRGGLGVGNVNRAAYKGEGHVGDYATPSPLEMDNRSANGNGGGGGAGNVVSGNHPTGGGGGGNGTAGGTGQRASGAGGTGGSTAGHAELTTAVFGGGGGGCNQDGAAPNGGNGGGIIFVFAKSINISGGTFRANGNQGGVSSNTYGGTTSSAGGAGGSILFKCASGSFGSSLVTASGGAQVSATWPGGAGGSGRINIDHSGAVTGTTSPTFNDRTDSTIAVASGGGFIAFFM